MKFKSCVVYKVGKEPFRSDRRNCDSGPAIHKDKEALQSSAQCGYENVLSNGKILVIIFI